MASDAITQPQPQPQPLANAAEKRNRPPRRIWTRNPSLVAGLVLLAVLLVIVIVVPIVSPYSITDPDFSNPTFASPSLRHPLGTDNFGRDIFTRIAAGGRIDLLIAVVATGVTLIVGTILGLITGFFGGWIDAIIMRVVDLTVAIPTLVLVIALVAILGTGTMNIIYAIWLVGWVTYARIIRGETIVARRMEYVEAARVIGMGNGRIMWRHIVPNVIVAAVIFAMADVVLNILLSSSLSFLGLGVQSPSPEWGLMVSEARDFFLKDWRLMTYPGLAILFTGAAFGLIGDGLGQALRRR
ncbi:MAG: ABC transporter permease [Thermomicrobiales bacterium]